jgi:hypothetical protein
MIWWALISALSYVCLETAVAYSHVFTSHIASYSVCKWIIRHFFLSLVIWPLQACDCMLCHLVFSWRTYDNITFFHPNWILLHHMQAGRQGQGYEAWLLNNDTVLVENKPCCVSWKGLWEHWPWTVPNRSCKFHRSRTDSLLLHNVWRSCVFPVRHKNA